MSYFKFKSINFKNFIENSKAKLENSLYGNENEFDKTEHFKTPLESRIIKNIETLTQNEKIIWSMDSELAFRGVVVENCTFCDYQIIICKNQIIDNEKLVYDTDYSPETYIISFIKGILTLDKIEYFVDPYSAENNVLAKLLCTINKKLIQQKN